MNYPRFILLSLGFFGFVAAPTAHAAEQSLLARVTVYWHNSASGALACWNGARLHAGHCAVDPHRIPYGSKVVFPDATCVAVDTGPDVVNRRAARACGRTVSERAAIVVDRYFETKAEAMEWIGQHPHFMTLRVIGRDAKPKTSSKTAQADSSRRRFGIASTNDCLFADPES
jgi:3D (Asp-Asp-Asp) domain-containing protein